MFFSTRRDTNVFYGEDKWVRFRLLVYTGVGGVSSLYGFLKCWLHLASGRAGWGVAGVGRVLVTLLLTFAASAMVGTRGRDDVRGSSARGIGIALSGGASAGTSRSGAAIAIVNMSAASVSAATNGSSGSLPFNGLDSAVDKKVLVSVVTVITIFKLPMFVLFMVFFFHCGGQGTHCHLTRRTVTTKRPLPRGFVHRGQPTSRHSRNVGGAFAKVKLFVFL